MDKQERRFRCIKKTINSNREVFNVGDILTRSELENKFNLRRQNTPAFLNVWEEIPPEYDIIRDIRRHLTIPRERLGELESTIADIELKERNKNILIVSEKTYNNLIKQMEKENE